MQLMLSADLPEIHPKISYTDKILLVGSCFTENMVEKFDAHKFTTMSNPHGILFNPLSVADSINSYVSEKLYTDAELFYLNELWNSWEHHTRFSDTDKQIALDNINISQQEASRFIRDASWIIITLGSAFQYYLKGEKKAVANNHRAPAQWFEKRLLETQVIIRELDAMRANIFSVNAKVNILFTISPVRHIRDGVIENNRSKARLIEAVHELCSQYNNVHYFGAYEIVIDVLRDYRYYDIDFVHPNYLATSFVWEQFVQKCIAKDTQEAMKEVQDIAIALSHRPRFPETEAHKKFLNSYANKVEYLTVKYPYLNFDKERDYFQASKNQQ